MLNLWPIVFRHLLMVLALLAAVDGGAAGEIQGPHGRVAAAEVIRHDA
jgi:hypothetical protein